MHACCGGEGSARLRHHVRLSQQQERDIARLFVGADPEVAEVLMLVASELLHEGLTCVLAAKRFGLLEKDNGACGSVLYV